MVQLMDLRKIEKSPGLLAQRKAALAGDEIVRPPLAPSEKNNAVPGPRKPRTREITSRYKSGITPTTPSLPTASASRRCPSPSAPRTVPVPCPLQQKRSQSAERRRPITPLSRSSAPSSPSRSSTPSSPPTRHSTPVRDSTIDMHNSSRRLVAPRTADGLWPSIRSLSSSFISESVSAPTSKRDKPVKSVSTTQDHTLKPSATGSLERKKTPVRGRTTLDQLENSKPLEISHSRTADQHRWPRISGAKLSGNAMTRSMDLTPLPISARGVSPRRRTPASDSAGAVLQKSISDGMRRMSFDGVGRADREISCVNVASNNIERPSSATRPSRTQSLPVATAQRPSSPLKASLPTTFSRGMTCSSQTRPMTPFTSLSSLTGRSSMSSSVLSYIVDARKGKKNATHLEDVHRLRLLYNQHLQWRFANARAEASLAIQKMISENALYNLWHMIHELQTSVTLKRISSEQLRQDLKLATILKEQMEYLENWALLEREHSSSLSGSIEALKASTVRLPVTGGAKADVHAMKDAINSAVDVMQAMGSSICYLLTKAESTNSGVSELARVTASGSNMINESKELLVLTAALQVQESSLRTHLLQVRKDIFNVGSET